jgi:hypothetical protein
MDTSKFPICPKHNKKMNMGKKPGDFYCPTVIGKNELGQPIYCKEKEYTGLKWV